LVEAYWGKKKLDKNLHRRLGKMRVKELRTGARIYQRSRGTCEDNRFRKTQTREHSRPGIAPKKKKRAGLGEG